MAKPPKKKQPSIAYGRKLRDYDWSQSTEGYNHWIRTIVTPTAVYENLDGERGTKIAFIAPGFQFYWAHSHIHVDKV